MISGETYEQIKRQVIQKLANGLSKDLYYHGVHHTLDVLTAAEKIATSENVGQDGELLLLKLACLYHDSGFLVLYRGHEEEGCKMVQEDLPSFGFSDQQIQIICNCIMATKIPQTPGSKLEKIICDADLDYLGRTDFFPISNTLYREKKERGWVTDEKEWNRDQVLFLESHHYFTPSSNDLREPQKQKHLDKLKRML